MIRASAPKFDNILARLYARALGGIQVYGVMTATTARVPVSITTKNFALPKRGSTDECRLSPPDVIASFISVLWVSGVHVTCQRVLTLRGFCYGAQGRRITAYSES